MKLKGKLASLVLCGVLTFNNLAFVFADGTNVVTIGADLNESQRATMLKYFGVNENEVEILEVNNQEERKYLEGIASESQIGRKTYSCAYVKPTSSGGINVKTANLTWLTSSTIASILTTLNIENAEVVVAAHMPMTGTGALTGIMKAFESATGEELDEDKKELASEELIITGDLGEDVGTDKAAGIINDIKTEIIKNNTSDTIQIAETINNVTNNYNVTLTSEQQKQLEDFMLKISKQDYDYKAMKDTLNGIKNTINEKLEAIGEAPKQNLFESVKNWFGGIGDWFKNLFDSKKEDSGILGSTNDELLGENAIIDATDESTINLPSSEEVQGFFSKIWNWFTGLFKNNNSDKEQQDVSDSINQEEVIEDIQDEASEEDALLESLEENSKVENNVQVEQEENKMESTQDSVEETDSINDVSVEKEEDSSQDEINE